MADFTSVSDEDLEKMLKNPESIPVEQAETEAPKEPEPEPEPEPEATEDDPAEAEPEETEPEPDEDYEKARLRMVVDELEARQKAMDSKLGRFAGEADFWRKKAEALRSEPRQEQELPYESEPEVAPEYKPSTAPRKDSVVTWAVNQALQAGVNKFESEHPESAEIQEAIVDYVKHSGYDIASLSRSDDPMAVHQEVQRVLSEAFWHAKAQRSAEMRANMESKRTEQFSRQKQAKQRASMSGSGAVSAPKPAPKSLNDLTDAELDSEMRRLSAR